jgi:DNA processing protein
LTRLSPAERRDWLRLIRTDSIGPIIFAGLLQRFGSAAAAIDALPDLARRSGRARPLSIPSRDKADDELAVLNRLGARLIASCEPNYPPALAALEDAPPLLTVRGKADILLKPTIALVGARNASANGIRFARMLAKDLGEAGFTVVSGLARGIDTGAHQGALATGTVAVMAGGVDIIYPLENDGLYGRILETGAAVSEMRCGLEPRAPHFPRRNRLISGLSQGVVVVEAALRSGSLITARLAGEQGREVFAVPGSPLDPRAHGTNDLLRQGATLTEGADDILRILAPGAPFPIREAPVPALEIPPAGTPATGPELEIAKTRIVEKLGINPVAVDEIIRQCHLSPATVLTVLLELELGGRLNRHPGNQVSMLI